LTLPKVQFSAWTKFAVHCSELALVKVSKLDKGSAVHMGLVTKSCLDLIFSDADATNQAPKP